MAAAAMHASLAVALASHAENSAAANRRSCAHHPRLCTKKRNKLAAWLAAKLISNDGY